MHDNIIQEVERLIHVCREGEELFRNAADRAPGAHLKSLLEEYASQRRTFISELQNEAVAFGEPAPTDDGSHSRAIGRGWSKLKASNNSPGAADILAGCESAEDSAVEAYKAAIELSTLPDGLRDIVARQYAEITSAHQNLRDLRDSVVPL